MESEALFSCWQDPTADPNLSQINPVENLSQYLFL
jgi:hypothetical protein